MLKHQAVKTERLRYLVDNEWRTSKTAKYMPVMNPSTGEQIAETPCCPSDRGLVGRPSRGTRIPGMVGDTRYRSGSR